MGFLDDVMVWGDRKKDVQEQLNTWVVEGPSCWISFNARKIEYGGDKKRGEENEVLLLGEGRLRGDQFLIPRKNDKGVGRLYNR